MKKKITLFSFMLLIAAFTFGLNAQVKKQRKSTESSFEKQLNASGSKDRINNYEYAFQKNRLNSQSTLHKSAQTIKQRLDSLISQEWNETTSQWVADDKEKYTYDANGRMTQILEYEWDETTSQWLADWKSEYTYDANANIIQYIENEWDQTTSQWVAYYKDEYTYDANGNMTQNLSFNWNDTITQWLSEYKNEYIHDANGKMTQYFVYEWDQTTSQWVAIWKREYTNDANGNMTQSLYYEREETNQWAVYWKREYSYDANRNMTQSTGNKWDEITSQWVAESKEEYTYDANGNMTQFIYFDRGDTIQWLAYNKSEHAYDINGNPALEIYYELNETTNQLVAKSKYEYSYDFSYNLSELITPLLEWFIPDYSDKIINKPLEYSNYVWDETNNVWVDRNKSIYYYSEQNITSVTETNSTKLTIFPNPVSDNISFIYSGNFTQMTFELFDIQGIKVLSQEIKSFENISLKDFNSGIYIYHLISDGFTQSGKLIRD